MIQPIIEQVTERIRQRSAQTRQQFLAKTAAQLAAGKGKASLSCGNLAHAIAASCSNEKSHILDLTRSNLAIITAYNDMLSAHQSIKTTLSRSKPHWHRLAILRKWPAAYRRCAMA